MGARSRRKGSAFELRIAKLLSAWAGEPGSFRRTPLSGGWDRQRAPGDIQGPDWWRWPIECKDRKGWTWETTLQGAGPVWDWWAEAKEINGVLVVHAPRSAVWLMVPGSLASRLQMDHVPLLNPRAYLTAPGDDASSIDDGDVYLVPYLYDLHHVLEVTDPAWWREIGSKP